MISRIEGIAAEIESDGVIVMVGGIGLKVFTPQGLLNELETGKPVALRTHLIVKEDLLALYGFKNEDELNMFTLLLGVSGVGPKLALGLLGAMNLHDLQMAILMDDTAALTRAPGIGKKTAQRIALELRDKIRQEDISAVFGSPAGSAAPAAGDSVSLALEALISLGYSAVEARSALAKVRGQSEKTEELISLALRAMTQM